MVILTSYNPSASYTLGTSLYTREALNCIPHPPLFVNSYKTTCHIFLKNIAFWGFQREIFVI